MLRQRTAKKLAEAELTEYALRALAARALAAGELRTKLTARAADPESVDRVIAKLTEIGYLNDKRFAENYAGARRETDGMGRARALRDLRAHRVEPELAEKAVADVYEGVDEIKMIEDYVERRIHRFRSGARLADPKELASAYRKLIRAGFTTGNVLRVLKRIAKEPEVVDTFEPPVETEE